MNVSIRDRAVYETLNPTDLAAYLRSANWTAGDNRPGHSSTWRTTFDGQMVELMVPLNRQYKDYVDRMAETVPLIAAVEKRSELEVLGDIQTASSDVVRVRYRYASAHDGSIPLDRGEALVENTRELFLAGACAAVAKRPYFGNFKAQQARDYVQTLRLGQSERGSYVITVLSPVPPQLNPKQVDLFGADVEQPYERLAVTQMSKALVALRAAADEAMTSFQTDGFDRAVQDGVSANLCSALVGIGGPSAQPNDELVVSFTWARSRPADAGIAREIVFPGDRFPVISEAARLYRRTAPAEETEIRGVIVALKADHAHGPLVGPVTVRDILSGRPRKVQINLDEPSHRLAWEAYESRAEVTCRGILTRSGTNLAIQTPRDFAIVSDE
ncbi:hypothetical protein [Zavarzinella formosa]|uniref:hypothetical protein n=1 Tax=Zavarzinella formosa TaxID=360055 RepID=UPI0002E1E013|nr:hypothetical protein [Zavarzinella formosa]